MIKQNSDFDLPAFAANTALKGFLAAWNRWRGDAIAPKRSEISLADIPGLMRGGMLLDAYSPNEIVFRFAGSLYQEMYGFEFTGKNYIDLTEPDMRALRSSRLWGVVSQPAAAVWTIPNIDVLQFIGASVPVVPDNPDEPMKIMQMVVMNRELSEASHKERAKQRDAVPYSDRFQYIDIGAGKPDSEVEA